MTPCPQASLGGHLDCPRMSRFESTPDPVFWTLNASLAFDRRLAPYDIRQSRAHATALRRAGVLDDSELTTLLDGLNRVQSELDAGEFPFEQVDEDIHMAIERRLTEIVGTVGGKIHTGRSRNDQVATDLAMFVGDHARVAVELLAEAMEVVLGLAREHRDWRMPGYTHLQRAQPVSLGHHLLAWFWMLRRDADRFASAAEAASVMPLGSGALAGLNWELDRHEVAAELGFASIAPNSMDGVANRDFALDYLAAAATCSTHLSRVGSEIVIWSSSEFGFCRPAEEFSSGSSIMPQKMNPDAAELLRAKAPRVVASYTTLLGVQHALPLAYSKDLQEDKEPLFDAVETVELCLRALRGMLGGIAFDRERMAEAAADELVAATDIADLLVRRGMPFRDAHGVVGGLVREALERKIALSEIEPERLGEFSELLDEEYYEVLASSSWLDSKVSEGGTSRSSVDAQLDRADRALAELRS
jgi:argininosuccinate lyase